MELNGVSIPNIRSVKVSLDGPADSTGLDSRKTIAATVIVERDASENAIVDLFGFATNIDGHKNIMTKTSTVEFVRDDHKISYKFDFKNAYISEWSLLNPADSASPALESFTLRVGHIAYYVSGKQEEVYEIEFV
jgi:hypothetical protein